MNINATIIGQATAFVIFIVFCMKYVWPPIMQALEERKKTISDSFEAANRASRELELAEEKTTQTLRESKDHAAEIIDQANKHANQIIDESRGQVISDSKRLREAVQSEIEQDVIRAKEVLREQVSILAFAGAEKILGATINKKVHGEIVEQLAREL